MLFWNRWNQESAGRVYFNISREKPAHTPDTPHVHTLSYKLEWTNQKHFYCFLLKPIRDNLVPGFTRALPPWPSCPEELWGRDYTQTMNRCENDNLPDCACLTRAYSLLWAREIINWRHLWISLVWVYIVMTFFKVAETVLNVKIRAKTKSN